MTNLWLVRRLLCSAVVAGLLVSCTASTHSVRAGRSTQHVSTTGSPSSTEPDTIPPVADTSSHTGGPVDSPHTRGVGDVLFPDLGNPGLDVTHYEVDLTYVPATRELRATAALTIIATAELTEFSLDAVGLTIDTVEVDGNAAKFTAQEPELVITPSTPVSRGDSVDVTINYSVAPNSSGSPAGIENGWFPTATGSYVVNEPDGARTWLPSNDHPSDKATYRFQLRVPTGVTAVANGVLDSHTTSSSGEIWTWSQTEPMATYLIQVLTGPYDIIEGVGPNGLPLSSVVLSSDRALMQPFVDAAAAQIDFFDDYFGPYPLKSYGIAITDSASGLAMEEQGRSLFSRDDFVSGKLGRVEQLLLSHELAHQWFGDAVSPQSWQDIWLNESFATYGEWMWLEHVGESTVADRAFDAVNNRQNGTVSTARPGAAGLFGYEVYDGGAVVLHALRLTIGDLAFFQVLQSWVKDNWGTSRSTTDFIALAEKVSATDLKQFFEDWLFAVDLPNQLPR